MREAEERGLPATTAASGQIDELAQQVAALRAERADDRAELEALQRELRRTSRRRRRHHRGDDASRSDSGQLSRRRLFGLLGGAAAAGAGLAVGAALGADPAEASGTMMFGTSNDAGTDATILRSSSVVDTLTIVNPGSGFAVIANTSAGSGIPLDLVAPAGASVVALDGSSSSSGPPTSGGHNAGEIYQDQNRALFYCTSTGTPGTWANLSAGERLVTLSTPVRVFDSRFGQPNFAGNGNTQGSLAFTVASPANARTINCANDYSSGTTAVPSSATALLINLTVIPVASVVGALAAFANGAAQPSTSTINWSSGVQVLANAATSACDSSQKVKVAIVATAGASTDFLIDVIGYYA